ncbi:MAG: DUF1330 domain-containing protein [Acidobacteriota bacterium]|nr:DUF1330 domain-containing protein [Acidobacteriota bacterium]
MLSMRLVATATVALVIGFLAGQVNAARAAGLEMVARGNPRVHVREGAWTLAGDLAIEKYRSMEELLKFWNSPEYQEAKKLREGLSKIDLIVAIDGL